MDPINESRVRCLYVISHPISISVYRRKNTTVCFHVTSQTLTPNTLIQVSCDKDEQQTDDDLVLRNSIRYKYTAVAGNNTGKVLYFSLAIRFIVFFLFLYLDANVDTDIYMKLHYKNNGKMGVSIVEFGEIRENHYIYLSSKRY